MKLIRQKFLIPYVQSLINKDKSDKKKSTRTWVHLKLWDLNLYEDSRIITWFYSILQKIQKQIYQYSEKFIFSYLYFQLRNWNPDEDRPDLTIRVIDSGFLITFDLLGYEGPLAVVHAPIAVREQVILCLIIKVLDAHFENHPIPGRRISCFPRLRRWKFLLLRSITPCQFLMRKNLKRGKKKL